MDYEWDEVKRNENLARHGVDFAAVEDFDWSTANINPSARYGEARWVAVGYIGLRLYKVVFTLRGPRTRIISLHTASRQDRREYGQTP